MYVVPVLVGSRNLAPLRFVKPSGPPRLPA